FLVWFFALDAVGHLSSALREDLHIGILEQIALTPYSLIYNMIGRSVARFFITLLNAIIILFIFNLLFELNISVPFSVLPVFLLTYLGLYGLGLFFAGLTLIFKRLGPVTTITRFMLLIFTGAIIPVNVFPGIFQKISAFLPMTSGLQLMKNAIFNGGLQGDITSFFSLIVNTTSYLFLGVLVFLFFEKRARKLGTLGSY
ncbi:MAG: ABC transporter permease, partial [Proteobacteria bacterium]|nr:ABC transporter permease [Pseudomonadota bacterium]